MFSKNEYVPPPYKYADFKNLPLHYQGGECTRPGMERTEYDLLQIKMFAP